MEQQGLLRNVRLTILAAVASGLAYLHDEWVQCILHRDIKGSNVLLDAGFNAYLGRLWVGAPGRPRCDAEDDVACRDMGLHGVGDAVHGTGHERIRRISVRDSVAGSRVREADAGARLGSCGLRLGGERMARMKPDTF